MLNSYLNQTAVYHCKTGTDDRGQPIYGDQIAITCRYQPKLQNVVTATGQTVQTQHIYYTTQAVNEGDMLNGKIVMAVSTWYGLNGEVMGYKAVV